MLNQILLIVLIAAGTILPLLLAWLSPKARSWIVARVDNAQLEGILLRLEAFVTDVVIELDQTIVDKLKKQGKWNAEEAVAVKALALDKVKLYLGAAGVKEAMAILGLDNATLEQLLSTLIEAAVRDHKL